MQQNNLMRVMMIIQGTKVSSSSLSLIYLDVKFRASREAEDEDVTHAHQIDGWLFVTQNRETCAIK